MTRIISSILIFLILMNGTVTIMSASGLNEDLGVTLAPGIDNQMDKVVQNMKQGFSPSAGTGETLFSLFLAAGNLGAVLVTGVYAAPQAFIALGFPEWVVYPLFAPAYVVGALYVVYLLTGRSSI